MAVVDGLAGAVSVSAVSKRFGDFQALHTVDLEIRGGEFVTLLGPSGSGKTTLLRIVGGFELPTSGRVLVAGDDVTDRPPESRPLNMVFQRYALFPHLSVAENIAYGLVNRSVARNEIRDRVIQVLEMVDMGSFGARKVDQLSGGQAQRVALARALVNRPTVLLLDEPLAALDLKLRRRMQVELRGLHQKLGTTFVFVTHDQEEALRMSDRVAVMNNGRIIQVGTPEEIYAAPKTAFVASFIGESTLMSVDIVETEGNDCRVRVGPGGKIIRARITKSATVSTGERCTLMVRPEDVRVAKPGEGSVSGTLRDAMFMGAVYRHIVDLDGGIEGQADLAQLADYSEGQEIDLDWDWQKGTVVPGDAP